MCGTFVLHLGIEVKVFGYAKEVKEDVHELSSKRTCVQNCLRPWCLIKVNGLTRGGQKDA